MAEGDDSLLKDELTLPIDWENSGRMSFIGNLANSDETLLEERKNMKKTPTQPFTSMPDLTTLPPTHSRTSETSNSGGSGGNGDKQIRLTPLGTRPLSLKEYEQQLNDLKKENFNLKLRIYFLENKLPKFDGCSGEDVLKKNVNLQIEVETIKNELDKKEKLLQDAMHTVKRIQITHDRELEECRREAEEAKDKDRQELIRCSSHLTALRNQFDEIGKTLVELDAENRRLKEMAAVNNQFSESDTEISLLSEKERLIMSLKTQIVQMEQQLADQKQKYEEELLKSEEKLIKSESNAISQSLAINASGTVDVQVGQPSASNFTVWVMQQRQDFEFNRASYPGFETGMLLPTAPPSGFDEKLFDLQKQLEEKSMNLKTLDDQLQLDRLELRQKIDENENLKQNLQVERDNGLKRDKAIQGLLKVIDNERNLALAAKEGEFTLGGVSSLTDPSLLCASLTEDKELENHHKIELESLKKRLKEIEMGRESLYKRIQRVAEFLLQLAEKFGGDARNVLMSLSTDLSKIQDEFLDASTNLVYVEDNEIDKLRTDLIEKNAKIASLIVSLDEQQRLLDDLKLSQENFRHEIDSVRADLSDKQLEISKLSASVDEKNRKISSLTENERLANEKFKKELNSVQGRLNSALEEKKREVSALISSLDEKNRKIDNILTFLNEKDGIISDLTISNENLRSELKKMPENLNSELDDVKKEISKLLASVDEKDRRIASFISSSKEKDRILKELTDEVNRRKLDENLNIELDEKKREILRLILSLEEKDRMINNLLASSDISEKELKTAYDQVLIELDLKSKEISRFISSMDEKDQEIANLLLKNEKLERYGKTLKAKYRKLESHCKCTAASGSENLKQNNRKQTFSVDDELETLLNGEQERNVRLETVVKQLEENNKVLAERLMEHEQTDGALKREAAKVQSLKAKVATYEKKFHEAESC